MGYISRLSCSRCMQRNVNIHQKLCPNFIQRLFVCTPFFAFYNTTKHISWECLLRNIYIYIHIYAIFNEFESTEWYAESPTSDAPK